MSGDLSVSGSGNGLNKGETANVTEWPNRMTMVRAGVIGGLVGAVIIWIYEALIWVGAQHLMPLAGSVRGNLALLSPARLRSDFRGAVLRGFRVDRDACGDHDRLR